MRRFLLSLSLLLAGSLSSRPADDTASSARRHLDELREKVRAAHTAGDGPAYLERSLELREFLHGTPSSIMQVMSAQAFNHDDAGALLSFEQFIAAGQSAPEAMDAPVFADLRKSDRFKALEERMRKNETPVAGSSPVFEMPEAGLIAEDVDYDAVKRRFYISSVLRHEIVCADRGGHFRVFATAPDARPMLALKIDARRRRLWATEVGLNGFASVPKGEWKTSVILIYDLDSGRLVRRVPGPPNTTLGDMALTPDGDAIVVDNDGAIYRVRRDTLGMERLDGGEFVSPQTPAISPDGRVAYIPDYLRGIATLDLTTKGIAWMDGQGRYALNGIDGLYLSGRTLVATQNGISPERVVRFELDPSLTRIESETVVEQATPHFGDPTHGVVMQSDFFFIANSGWDTLEDDGTLKAGAAPSKALLKRAELGGAAAGRK